MSQPLFARPLTDEEIAELEAWVASEDEDQSHRAKVILHSARGKTAYDIGALLGAHPDNLKKWIRAFNQQGIDGIAVRKRGPQSRFTPEQIDRILDIHGQSPRRMGLGFDYWTPQKLADHVVEQGIVPAISHVTMRQILRARTQDENSPSDGSSGNAGAPVVQFEPPPTLPKIRSAAGEESYPSVLARDLSQVFKPVGVSAHLSDSVPSGDGRFETGYSEGQALIRQGDYVSACRVLQKLLDAPESVSAEAEAQIRCWLSEAFEGLGRYEEALAVVKPYEDPAVRPRLNERLYAWTRLRLGIAYARAGIPKAITRLNEALRSFMEQDDFQGISAAQYGLSLTYCEVYNEYKLAQDHLNRALDYEQLITDRRLLARIYLNFGMIKFREGAYADATKHYQKVLQIARQIEDHRSLGATLMNLGVASYELGKFKASAEYYSAALEEFKQGAQINFMARTYCNLADGLLRLGRWNEVDHYLIEARKVAEQLDDRGEIIGVLITGGELRLVQGQLAQAEESLQHALELMNENDRSLKSYTQRILAQVYHLEGRTDQAFKTLRSALQRSTIIADIQSVYWCHLCLAELHFSQEGYDQAEEYLELAKEQVKASQDLTASGIAQRLQGQLAAARGRLAEAEQHIESSLTIFKTLEDKHKLALSHLAMGTILMRKGDPVSAAAFVRQARDAFAEMGASLDLARAETQLEQLRHGTFEFPVVHSGPRSQGAVAAGASDLLLLMRLMEAATSRDLLLQELTSILQGHFDIQRAVVWRVQDADIQPLTGLTPQEAAPFVQTVALALSDRRSLPPGHLIHVLEDRPPARLVLWLEARNGGFDMERLKPYLKQVEMGLEYAALRSQGRFSPSGEAPRSHTLTSVPGFIYSSLAMGELIEKIQRIRTSDVPVLITGESGTGKELIARAIHAESKRRDHVFLPFNCTTSTPDMIDSQLFGYRRGAFTGAFSNHIGMIRAAENGTLFLDEIGDLAIPVQPKLLRFLQEGEIQPLGETRPVTVDVRVVAATNADLEQAVEEGRFREDLFYRLNIIHLHVPPMRERREEIPLLAAHFLEHFMNRDRKRNITFSREAMHALSAYSWPGNVRQLRTEIQRVVAYANDGEVISPADLSHEITSPRPRPVRAGSGTPRPVESDNQSYFGMPRFSSQNDPPPVSPPAPLYAVPAYANEPAPPPAGPSAAPPTDGRTLREVTDEIERKMILEMLAKTNYNVSRTARELGLSRRGLKLKMEQLEIDAGRAVMN